MILRNILIAVSGVVSRTSEELLFHEGAGVSAPYADAEAICADSTNYSADNN